MSGMHDGGGRSRMGGGDYSNRRGYGSQGGSGYGHSGPGLMDSGVMSHGMGSSGYGMGGGGYDVDGLLQQRSLQQQLSLRESQLALANSLLQQQQHQSYMMEAPGMGMRGAGALGPSPMGMSGMMMNKRRQDMRQGDYMPDFKRPRNDFSPRPRDRYRRDSEDGNRGYNYRRNQSSSHSSNRSASGKGAKDSADKYDPEKPTDDDDREEEKSKESDDPFHCHVCNTNCQDADGFRRHMNSNRHKDRMSGVLAVHEEKSNLFASRMKAEKYLRRLEDEDKFARGYCKTCDVSLDIRYVDHQRLSFHRKRVMQVTKGCGWCGVSSFKNFTEVLAHRETEEHQKNQKEHEGSDAGGKRDSQREGSGASSKKRAPIRVEIPAELAKYDPDTTYGQVCVVPVTGWFCKLCNKFNNNETAAKETHCKTESHYVKYKRFVYAKLRAKAEEEREAEEKAAAEAEAAEKEAAEEGMVEGEGGEKNGTAAKGEGDDDDGDGDGDGGDDEDMAQQQEGDDAGAGDGDQQEDGQDQVERAGDEEEDDDDGENAVLAVDGTAMDFDHHEEEEGAPDDSCLLDDTRDNSAYQTAEDNTVDADTTGEGDSCVDGSALSLVEADSGSDFMQFSHTSGMEQGGEEEILEGDQDLMEEEEEEKAPRRARATRNAVNPRTSSTPVSGRGRGTGKARRARKMAK